jgi:uncharacterized membrane protein YphA (DoxX/SURF4 family)
MPVATVRIAMGTIALVRGVAAYWLLWPLTDSEIVKVPFVAWMPSPTPVVVAVVLGSWVVAAACFAIGFHTRLAGTVLAVAMALVLFIDQQAYSNHLYLLIVIVGLLVVAGPAGALSVDNRRGAPAPPANWAVLLIKLQITVVYLFAAITKINASYLAGSVLSAQVGRGLIQATWAAQSSALMRGTAFASIVLEVVIGLYLWHPQRRYVAVGAGVLLHGGITLLMPSPVLLGLFGAIMLSSYLLFIPPTVKGRWVAAPDGLAARLRRHDVLNVLDVEDGVSLTTSRRGVHTGWAALVRICDELPAWYLAAPLLRLVPARAQQRWLTAVVDRPAEWGEGVSSG